MPDEKHLPEVQGFGFKLTPEQENAFVSQLSEAMDKASVSSLKKAEGPIKAFPRQGTSRRLGIVQFSEPYFHESVERGFKLPPGTHVRGVRHDEWRGIFDVLVSHDSFPEVGEGYRIPMCDLIIDTIEGTSRFRLPLVGMPTE